MSSAEHSLSITEKVGYSLGDAAANFVWRAGFFLPFFYTEVFGISAAAAAIILLVVRLSDGVTDIIMGSIADRTDTKAGKFRPWVIWTAPVLAIFLALLFTTPDFGNAGKLAYAFVVYFVLQLVYTANNVPYGAMMGVMTSSVKERSLLSGYRFAGAFGGGILVMALTPWLVGYFGNGDQGLGYKYTYWVFAILLVIFFSITYFTTSERVKPVVDTTRSLGKEIKDLMGNLWVILLPILGLSLFFITLSIPSDQWALIYEVFKGSAGSESDVSALGRNMLMVGALLCLAGFISSYVLRSRLISKPVERMTHTQRDLADLLSNRPWFVLLLIGVMFGIFTVVRPSAAMFYLTYYLDRADLATFYFFAVGAISFVAALATGYLTRFMSKKVLFAGSFGLGAVFTAAIYFVSPEQTTLFMTLAIISEFFAGILPALFFGMLGDAADYSEWKNKRRATGLVFSAGTFVNKTGHGFAGAIVVIVLAKVGFDSSVAETIPGSLEMIKGLMSWIPAGFAIAGMFAVALYPLTNAKLKQIETELAEQRKSY